MSHIYCQVVRRMSFYYYTASIFYWSLKFIIVNEGLKKGRIQLNTYYPECQMHVCSYNASSEGIYGSRSSRISYTQLVYIIKRSKFILYFKMPSFMVHAVALPRKHPLAIPAFIRFDTVVLSGMHYHIWFHFESFITYTAPVFISVLLSEMFLKSLYPIKLLCTVRTLVRKGGSVGRFMKQKVMLQFEWFRTKGTRKQSHWKLFQTN